MRVASGSASGAECTRAGTFQLWVFSDAQDDDLAELAIDSTHTVEIEKFASKASIDDRYQSRQPSLPPGPKRVVALHAALYGDKPPTN